MRKKLLIKLRILRTHNLEEKEGKAVCNIFVKLSHGIFSDAYISDINYITFCARKLKLNNSRFQKITVFILSCNLQSLLKTLHLLNSLGFSPSLVNAFPLRDEQYEVFIIQSQQKAIKS